MHSPNYFRCTILIWSRMKMLMKNTSTNWTTHPRKSQITQENTQTIASHFCDQPSQNAKKLFSLYQSEQLTLIYPIYRRNGSTLLLLNFTSRKLLSQKTSLSAQRTPPSCTADTDAKDFLTKALRET